jgi:hypothetical protein
MRNGIDDPAGLIDFIDDAGSASDMQAVPARDYDVHSYPILCSSKRRTVSQDSVTGRDLPSVSPTRQFTSGGKCKARLPFGGLRKLVTGYLIDTEELTSRSSSAETASAVR